MTKIFKEEVMEQTLVVKKEGDKEVTFAKVIAGKHEGKILRIYSIRKKDGVVLGKDIASKKNLAVGKGSMSQEFRDKYNLTSGRVSSSKDFSDVLNEFGVVVEEAAQETEAPKADVIEKAPQTKSKKG